jgi:methylglutaconyl-CoA hydratase
MGQHASVLAMDQLVRYERDGPAGRVTLDSPRNRNALSVRLLSELRAALDEALADDAVRVVVLTGTGPVFSSGVDLREQREQNERGQVAPAPRLMTEVFTTILEAPKPVLARVNGSARAGGVGLIGACDLAVAPLSATFGFAEVRVGVVPAVISVTILPHLLSRAARELFLTGEPFDATRAAEIGLLTRAVSDEGLDADVDRYIGMLRLAGPEALRETKRLLARRGPQAPLRETFEELLVLSEQRFGSAEALEGMRAFADKRPPSWAV